MDLRALEAVKQNCFSEIQGTDCLHLQITVAQVSATLETNATRRRRDQHVGSLHRWSADFTSDLKVELNGP
jgi:hypothetical protein